jgi:hypothetical protein
MVRGAAKVLGVLMLVAVLGLVLIVVLLSWWLGPPARPHIWQIPDGSFGWVVVQFEDPGCAPLASEGIYLVGRIPPNRRLCTSSRDPRKVGWTVLDRWQYVKSDGTTRDLDEEEFVLGGRNEAQKRWAFFIGRRSQLTPDPGIGRCLWPCLDSP